MRRSDVQIVAAFVALAIVCELAQVTADTGSDGKAGDIARSVATATAFLVAGLLARRRQPQNHTGLLMVLVGGCLLLEDLQTTTAPLVYTVGEFFRSASLPALAWLVLAFPSGRLQSGRERAIVIALAITAVFFTFPGAGVIDEAPCEGCTESLLHVADVPDVADALYVVDDVLQVALIGLIALIMLDRWRRSSRPARRVLTPFLVVAGLLGAVAAVDSGLANASDAHTAARAMTHALTILLPFAFLAGLVRLELARVDVVESISALGSRASLADLRFTAARALGDPALRLLRRDPDGRLVDEGGAPASAEAGPGCTELKRDERSLGVLIHDPALRQDDRLLDATETVLTQALERQRLVASAEEERRRLERDIHDGSQSRLISVGLTLRRVQAELPADSEEALELDAAVEELTRAIEELRELARGIRPPGLDDGLPHALRGLAARSPLPTRTDLVELRFAPELETAAYFVASEALANAAKHASASRALLTMKVEHGELVLGVSDDGVGGARQNGGSGLTGMAARVAALDGTLEVKSPAGGGTAITARLPV